MTKLTNEKQNLKNEIKHGMELEKEIAEKKENVLKTIKDSDNVAKENDEVNEENQKLSAYCDRIQHSSKEMVMPQVNDIIK